MGQRIFVPPIAIRVHSAQIYYRAVAQSSQPPNLCPIQRALAGVGAGCKNRRQKKNVRATAIGLVYFPGIMHRSAVQQPSYIGPSLQTTVYAISVPAFGQCR